MSFLWRTDALNDPRTWLIPNNLGKKLSKWKCSYEGQMPWIILEHGWYPSREVHPSPSHWSCTSQPNNSKLWDSFGILYFFLKAAIFPNNRVLANTMSFIKHLIFLRFPFPHLGNGKVRLNHLSLEIDIRPTSWSHDPLITLAGGKRRFSILEVTVATNKDGTMNNACLCTSELDLCPRGPPPQSKTIIWIHLKTHPSVGAGRHLPTSCRTGDKVPRELT